MSLAEIIILALALSIDAFAVSLAAAASGRINGHRATFRLSFHFGLFQFLMPVLGWLAGTTLESLLVSVDHWIAFALLSFVGVRMIRAGSDSSPNVNSSDPSKGLTLLMLSIATSIDALAVGLTLAMLNIRIWQPSIIIGLITATVCFLAIILGNRFEAKFGKKAEIVGGIIIIIIAVRILFSHIL
jgi:manganese efflux pump family protein